jgi:hypothetical protein
LLLKNAPNLSLEEHVSEDDWKIVKALATEKENNVNSKTLLELLNAYDSTNKSYIESLPLEMAVIAVSG